VDNGWSHRGKAAKEWLRHIDSRIMLVYSPVNASWLHQVDLSFSIIQRNVLTPNDFADLEALRLRSGSQPSTTFPPLHSVCVVV
jgi:hypothetical protein